jgi:hypothetical protein
MKTAARRLGQSRRSDRGSDSTATITTDMATTNKKAPRTARANDELRTRDQSQWCTAGMILPNCTSLAVSPAHKVGPPLDVFPSPA